MRQVDLAGAQHLLKPLLLGEIALRLWALSLCIGTCFVSVLYVLYVQYNVQYM
jgi:hypothetical protein